MLSFVSNVLLLHIISYIIQIVYNKHMFRIVFCRLLVYNGNK
nr:MAG TPA: hypothetical protein [Bacteriophage sp.]